MPGQQDPTTESPRPITVVVVDDEQMIRGALAQTLTGGGLDLVGEASNAQDALRLVVDVRPDVVLMDLRLPDSPGVQAIEQLALLAPASRILILTRTEQNRVVEAIVAGASGYILKTAPPQAIIAAVKATGAGDRSSPHRSQGNSCSASANATYPSPAPVRTLRARSVPS